MKTYQLLSVMVALVGLGATMPGAFAQGNGNGPPTGEIFAFDQSYRTVITPTSLPDRGKFDTLFIFPECQSCSPVSDAAPGHGNYKGGRWKVMEAYGITSQLTNSEDVIIMATNIVDTGNRFVCPLIR